MGVRLVVQSSFSGFRGPLRFPGKEGPAGLARNAEQPEPEEVGPVQSRSCGQTQKHRKAEADGGDEDKDDAFEKDLNVIYKKKLV